MSRLVRLIKAKRFRQTAAVVVILLTFTVFGYYLATHPEIARSIIKLNPLTLVLLSLAYSGTIAANAFVLYVSLRLIRKHVGYPENIALTGYSAVVNFFGPLQSGPGFRAAYLKKRHNVSLKRFFFVTVVFYGFFAAINSLILASSLLSKVSGMWLLVVVCVGLAGVGFAIWLVNRAQRLRAVMQTINLTDLNFWYIGLGAFLLSAATTIAYHIELTYINGSIHLIQTIVYTAAANLALFVSLTPGAIGFRESFLLLSQRLHEIPADTIIAASILDRAFYVVFLLVLFIALLLFGVASKLKNVEIK
jgi:uncharacterized membrane protein YbhN (UPF0104 family)